MASCPFFCACKSNDRGKKKNSFFFFFTLLRSQKQGGSLIVGELIDVCFIVFIPTLQE